ncbi:VOC family protein [Methanomethylophilus alvi]|uniref:VOC family protein n=1 Tax=Methanomethylophilus alvi TaxID=1291540 RepID=UPI0037DD8179
MRFVGTLVAVKDMERSRRFYKDVLGLGAVSDFGANVTLEGGIFLQTMDTWKTFIGKTDISLPDNAGELYFEESDFDAFCGHLEHMDVKYVHRPVEHTWGQRAVRLYDPDGHMIEVGEELDSVILRFIRNGMTAEETASRMDIPLKTVSECLERHGTGE